MKKGKLLNSSSFVITFTLLFITSCTEIQTRKAEHLDTAAIAPSVIVPSLTKNDTLKEYGITIQEMDRLMSRGIKPLTIAEQKERNKNIFLEDWYLKSNAHFDKKVHFVIKNGSEMRENVVAVKIKFISDSCHLRTILQKSVLIRPNETKVISKDLGKFDCKTINVINVECVLTSGDLINAQIPLPIERLLNKELSKN